MMKNATAPITRIMLATVTCGLFLGCSGTPRAATTSYNELNTTPAWASAMNEPIELIAPEPEQLHGTNDRHVISETWAARGRPADLTTPIGPGSAAPGMETDHVPTHGHTGTGGHSSIVVNINHQDTTQPDETRASLVRETPMGPLEQMYSGNHTYSVNRNLTQFGYDYFDRSDQPSTSGPVPDGYVLGPGDEVTISVTGTIEAYHRLDVERDGRIAIPEIGTVAVSGVRFDQLQRLIDSAYAERRRGYELVVGLGRVRTIQVHVVGEVNRPGLIELHAGSTLLDALSAASGPRKSGTLRGVYLRRTDAEAQRYDLYDFFLGGETPPAEVLRQGDVIHVPPIGPTVAIAGFVQRPGIYELGNGLTLEQAIDAAGGFTPFTFTPRIQIERTTDGRGRETLDIQLTQEDLSRALQDGEMLLIGAVDDRLQPIVRIEGEVVRPGSFQHRSGMRISDLIELADGLTIDAFTRQAFVSRQVGTTGQVVLVTDRVHENSMRRVLVIDLNRAAQGDPAHDIELFPLDHVTVRSRAASQTQPVVEVIGAVQTPGRYELTAGLRVSELIALAGNLLPEVHYDEAEIIRQIHNEQTGLLDVRRYRFDLGRAMTEGGRHDPILQTGDRLVIRRMRNAEVTAQISGMVRFPGEYVFPEGAKITDLIAAAGGLVDNADLRATRFTRESVRQLQAQRFSHLSEQTRRDFEEAFRVLVQTGHAREGAAGELALDHAGGLVQRMQHSDTTGRIVIPFTREDFPHSDYNLSLESGDRLHIPRRQETIAVIGCVFTPNSFVAAEGLTVSQALDRVGGTTELADDERVYVIRADGNVQSLLQDGDHRLSLSAQLLPGDVVLVPQAAPERTLGARVVDTLTVLRHAAELGLIGTQIGEPIGDFNYSTSREQDWPGYYSD